MNETKNNINLETIKNKNVRRAIEDLVEADALSINVVDLELTTVDESVLKTSYKTIKKKEKEEVKAMQYGGVMFMQNEVVVKPINNALNNPNVPN